MTTVEQAAQLYEYEQATEISRVRWLAEQGWRLHSVVSCGGNVVYVMERPAGGDLATRLAEVEAERDALAKALTRAGQREAEMREHRMAAIDALTAERDRLAGRVQRIWNIALRGGQDAESVRRELLAEMTPGELLQVRRAGPAGGVT